MCHAGTGEIARVIANAAFQPQAAAFTSMLSMCAKNREWQKALEVFQAMRDYHPAVRPNTVHYSSLISACATVGRCDEAMQVHAFPIDLPDTIGCCVLAPRTALVLSSCLPFISIRSQSDRQVVHREVVHREGEACGLVREIRPMPCASQCQPCIFITMPGPTSRKALQRAVQVLATASKEDFQENLTGFLLHAV